MRNLPEDKWEFEELEKLKAEPWMVELLSLNPGYTLWGPYEDYMTNSGTGWDSKVIIETWKQFRWSLGDLNECVNFYFSIVRESQECLACDRSGYNPETKKISDSWYSFDDPSRAWKHRLHQDEVDALIAANRVAKNTTAEMLNRGYHHDAINRSICVEARAKRLGAWGMCPRCNGDGSFYIEPKAHVALTLWILHPRKGCSRGVEVSLIEQKDLPAVFEWLKTARDRNAERFSKIP